MSKKSQKSEKLQKYEAVLVYGVQEQDSVCVLDKEILDQHELQCFATHVVNGKAVDALVYGVVVDLQDAVEGNDFEGEDYVDAFAEMFDYFESEPGYYLCLVGDYTIPHSVYVPEFEEESGDDDEDDDDDDQCEESYESECSDVASQVSDE